MICKELFFALESLKSERVPTLVRAPKSTRMKIPENPRIRCVITMTSTRLCRCTGVISSQLRPNRTFESFSIRLVYSNFIQQYKKNCEKFTRKTRKATNDPVMLIDSVKMVMQKTVESNEISDRKLYSIRFCTLLCHSMIFHVSLTTSIKQSFISASHRSFSNSSTNISSNFCSEIRIKSTKQHA